jgi:preprotein translocase subunit Sss1
MKKNIAMVLITALVIDLTACSSYRQFSTGQDFESAESLDEVEVLEIQSRPDGIIVFNEKFPGKIENERVYGFQQMHFPYSASNSIIFNKYDSKPAYIMNNGVRYRIISQDRSGFICLSQDTIRTSFSDIEQMTVKEKDPLKTTFLIMGLSSFFVGMIGYLISSNFTIYTQGM